MSRRAQPTFTFRAGAIGIASMVALAMWVHYHEVLAPMRHILAENSPPAGAVGILFGVMAVGGLVTWISRRLGRQNGAGLSSGELLVVYTMLITSAPLMSQGMWHRFLGLVVAVPHNAHNMRLVDAYSEKLWPHGEHLVADRRFADWPSGRASAHPADRVRHIRIAESPIGATTGIELVNPPSETEEEEVVTRLRIPLARRSGAREQLVPGERYYFTALFRLRQLRSRSRFTVALHTDGGQTVDLLTLSRDTESTFSAPGGFARLGEPYVSIPRDLNETVELVFTLRGPGCAALTDVVFFSNEALARLHKGSREVRSGQLERIPENARDSLLVAPDNLASPGGVWYTLKGYVPYRQWIRPLLYWLSIVMALFLCMLGIGVIFRKQWAENERFSFPMIVLPRLLLEQRDENGRLVRPLLRKPAFRAGVAVALAYCLMLGLAHYVPGIPDPSVRINMADYFSSPAVRAFIRGGMSGERFNLVLMFVSIAFFVDLDLLLSIVTLYWVCKVPYYFGEIFGWKTIRGPFDSFPFPHEQHIGAFLGLAVVVLWVSRKHLGGVARRIFGRPGGVDDSGEAMRYRTAAGLIAGAFVFFAVWGNLTGLGAGSALLFFGFLVVCGLSASRIRTECGAPFTYFTPYYPFLIFFLIGGLNVFGLPTMLLAYFAGGFMAVAQFLLFAPTQVEMLHLGNAFDARPRGVSWALVAGALGGILLGGYVMLVWAHGVGGENIAHMRNWAIKQDWYFTSLRDAVNQADQAAMADTLGSGLQAAQSIGPHAAVVVGVAGTVLLTLLRMRFVGFWLHPLGYVLANTYFVYGTWASLFLAWIVKSVGLKIGGPVLIRKHMTPFFAGIFCGGVVGMALWDAVALILQARGIRDVFTCWP